MAGIAHGDGAALFDAQALHQRAGFQPQVGAAQGRAQHGAGRGMALPAPGVDAVGGSTFGIGGIGIVAGAKPQIARGLEEMPGHRVDLV